MLNPGSLVSADNPDSFRALVESVKDYAIFLLDKDGIVRTWNLGAERIKGYSASEIIGKHFSIFYPPEAINRNWPKEELESAARYGRFEDEGWRVRKDGSKFWASVVITALFDSDGEVYGFAKVTRDMTQRMLQEQRLEESEKALRQLSQTLLRAQDEERRRIGRELHDTIGQYVAVLKLQLDQMVMTGSSKPKAADCAALADRIIKEVRTMSYLLYPPMLEENGLVSAITWFIEGFSKRSGVNTTLEKSDYSVRLPLDHELALFRVLQESLTNVHRHSGSKSASIRLTTESGAVTLEIADHGKGMPYEATRDPRTDSIGTLGVGVRGMTERMRQLHGSLSIQSGPEGTAVTATVPVPKTPKS